MTDFANKEERAAAIRAAREEEVRQRKRRLGLSTRLQAQQDAEQKALELGAQVTTVTEIVLDHRFGRDTKDGKRLRPHVSKYHVNCPYGQPFFVLMTVDIYRLPHTVTQEALINDNTCLAISQALKATGINNFLARALPDFNEQAGVYLVVFLQPVTGLPSPEEEPEQSKLLDPAQVPFNVLADCPGALMWYVGHDGKENQFVSLQNLQHWMAGGTTRSGKSNAANAALAYLMLNTPPDKLRVGWIDPKGMDSAWAANAPHLLASPITDPADATAINALFELAQTAMAERQNQIRGCATNVYDYNAKHPESALPEWVIWWDDFTVSVMLLSHEIKSIYKRLTDVLARGAGLGIHVALGVHNPDAKVVDSLGKGLLSTRFVFPTPTLPNHQILCGGVGTYNRYWKLLDHPGRSLFISPMSKQARLVQYPLADNDMLMDLAAREWGNSVQVRVATPTKLVPLTLTQYRLAAWSIRNTPGKFSRPKLAAAFDDSKLEGEPTDDNGPIIKEQEIKNTMDELKAKGLLFGGGERGSKTVIAPELEKRVQECEGLPAFLALLEKNGIGIAMTIAAKAKVGE